MKISDARLKATLDELYSEYAFEFSKAPRQFLLDRPDPIQFPHRYKSFHDREAAAFLAATFAYGNVSSLCAFVYRLLRIMHPSPHAFLMRGEEALREMRSHKPYYRLHKTDKIAGVALVLSHVYRTHGSLYELFLQSYDLHHTMPVALSSFVERLRSFNGEDLKFLIPSPSDGSPCKRLNLFLRWMVRRSDLDFGLWQEVAPADLIIPLDTHIGRIAYRLGWIDTPSLTWQKAEKITAVLRRFDPVDPLRYDFALCHESISKSPWLSKLIAKNRSV